jgi:hypothetical protein
MKTATAKCPYANTSVSRAAPVGRSPYSNGQTVSQA